MELSDCLEVAVESARKAGELLSRTQRLGTETLSQRGRDIKLQADRDSEKLILEALNRTPYPILAEESGQLGAMDSDRPAWVVDPLDGTFNYNRRMPLCCVSIALVQGSRSLIGVVYDFGRKEMYTGIPSRREASLNGGPMKVGTISQREQACLATGFPVNRDYSEESLSGMMTLFRTFKKIRMIGAAALSLAWVACGKVDAYFEEDIMFWDVAAGVALVEAAGGFVRVTDSQRLEWGKVVRCASSSTIWNEIEK